MSLHRFYLPPGSTRGDSLRLDGREAHHALRVLRLKRGELVAVLDGVGNEFLCAVENSSRDAVTLSVSLKNFTPPPPCSITLLQAVPKGKIIENIIQKAVELGARRIVPLLTERVVTQLDDGMPGTNATSGSRWPLKPSNNAARPGCRRLRRRSPPRNFWRARKISICHSSARCKRNAAIRAHVFRNFRRSTDVCRKASAFGLGRKAISRRRNWTRFKRRAHCRFHWAGWCCASKPRRFIAFPF